METPVARSCTFLAGAFYVTKKSEFLIFVSKNKVPGAILERYRAQGQGPGPRARDQWTGPKGGPVDRAQGPGPVAPWGPRGASVVFARCAWVWPRLAIVPRSMG